MEAKPAYTKHVQAGRVIALHRVENKNQLAVIVDIIDQNRGLIDGPSTGVPRQVVNFKRIRLTEFLLPGIKRGADTQTIKAAFDKEDILNKYNSLKSTQVLIKREKRLKLTDFDRFKVQCLMNQKNEIIDKKLAELKAK